MKHVVAVFLLTTVLLGDQAVTVSLDDAEPAIRDFRARASGLNA